MLGDGSALRRCACASSRSPSRAGPAGALKYAEDLLDERFLMLNGDVLTDIDLTAQIAQHEATGAVGTLALVPVDDPTAYGLVRCDDDHAVTEFVEKPSADQIDTNLISAGAYVLERAVLDLIPADATSRSSARSGRSSSATGLLRLRAPTAPTGSTSGRPSATCRAPSTSSRATSRTAVAERLGAATWPSASACSRRAHRAAGARRARLHDRGGRARRRLVVLGEGVTVGEGARVERSVVLDGAEIGAGCALRDCIVAAGRARSATGGDRARRRGARRGRDASGPATSSTRGVRVFPQTDLPDGAITF